MTYVIGGDPPWNVEVDRMVYRARASLARMVTLEYRPSPDLPAAVALAIRVDGRWAVVESDRPESPVDDEWLLAAVRARLREIIEEGSPPP
jgi:hypothetical protein